jgi:hypothetical protein
MKKLFKYLQNFCIFLLVSPFLVVWVPSILDGFLTDLSPAYRSSLVLSFQQLSITLLATLLFAALITLTLGYISILWSAIGKIIAAVLEAIESVPAILIVLFSYAPAASYLASHSEGSSSAVSLMIFIFAATLTILPESIRGITLPLGELYYQKYSLSFRSYGFRRSKILAVLMGTDVMRHAFKQIAAGILLKILVLDCSFGFIIQLGFGSYGTPAHASPGALIAANRDALFQGGSPLLFWLPVLPLVMVSIAFLLILTNNKEDKK